MRDLAKSMFRFSWAVSLFSLEQLGNLVAKKETEGEDREKEVSSSFDEVTTATEPQFSERAKNLFESGDKFQGEMVDMFFDFFSGESWSPKEILNRAADLVESSADALRGSSKDEDEETAEEKEPAAAGAAAD